MILTCTSYHMVASAKWKIFDDNAWKVFVFGVFLVCIKPDELFSLFYIYVKRGYDTTTSDFSTDNETFSIAETLNLI